MELLKWQKAYVDNTVEGMMGRLLNAKQRHVVFRIPEELREYFRGKL